jgi:hypothetical protein
MATAAEREHDTVSGLKVSLGKVMRSSAIILAAIVIVIVPLITSSSSGSAAARSHRITTVRTAVTPDTSCSALASDDFTAVPDAITQIASAAVTQFNGAQYCDVTGYISPQTQFQVDLPTTTWQGDYLQEGCGGRCGSVPFGIPATSSGCQQVTGNQMVLAADNMGHVGVATYDSAWAANNLDLRVVYGITSEHSLAQAAKAIIRAYYGRGPSFSYYDGCSAGGMEALREAELYPRDFNGIIAGSPTIFFGQLNAELHGWQVVVNTNSQGQDILTPDKLPALHAAVMKACANAQGLILDPRTCTFNPKSIECSPGTDTVSCLTPAQVTTVRELYAGPTTKNGGNLYPGGLPYGSELAWAGNVIAPAGQPAIDSSAGQTALGYLKYMAYQKDPSSSYTMADFRFTRRDFDALGAEERLYNATSPDLKAFQADGGKLIIYDGWADQLTVPFGTIAYYAAVAKYMGGYQASQSFSRLYMIPGTGHCLASGYVTVSADFLTPMINWVQYGAAPGSLTFPVTSSVASPAPASITELPFNPLIPVSSSGLNSGYHYIGKISPHYDTASLASIPPGQP